MYSALRAHRVLAEFLQCTAAGCWKANDRSSEYFLQNPRRRLRYGSHPKHSSFQRRRFLFSKEDWKFTETLVCDMQHKKSFLWQDCVCCNVAVQSFQRQSKTRLQIIREHQSKKSLFLGWSRTDTNVFSWGFLKSPMTRTWQRTFLVAFVLAPLRRLFNKMPFSSKQLLQELHYGFSQQWFILSFLFFGRNKNWTFFSPFKAFFRLFKIFVNVSDICQWKTFFKAV